MEYKLYVNGMRCNHCVKSIESAVKNIESVENCIVNLEEKSVTITSNDNNFSIDKVKECIDNLGFDIA